MAEYCVQNRNIPQEIAITAIEFGLASVLAYSLIVWIYGKQPITVTIPK